MAKAKRNWIQEERRKTLGDWVAFCLACGHTLRNVGGYPVTLGDLSTPRLDLAPP